MKKKSDQVRELEDVLRERDVLISGHVAHIRSLELALAERDKVSLSLSLSSRLLLSLPPSLSPASPLLPTHRAPLLSLCVCACVHTHVCDVRVRMCVSPFLHA